MKYYVFKFTQSEMFCANFNQNYRNLSDRMYFIQAIVWCNDCFLYVAYITIHDIINILSLIATVGKVDMALNLLTASMKSFHLR